MTTPRYHGKRGNNDNISIAYLVFCFFRVTLYFQNDNYARNQHVNIKLCEIKKKKQTFMFMPINISHNGTLTCNLILTFIRTLTYLNLYLAIKFEINLLLFDFLFFFPTFITFCKFCLIMMFQYFYRCTYKCTYMYLIQKTKNI